MALSNRIVIRFAIQKFSRAKFEILRVSRAVSLHRGVSLLALLMLLVAGAIAPLVGQQNARRNARENERDSAALIRKRADWFFKQRAYPLGFIPAGARMKAIQQMEEMRRAQGTLMDRFAAREQTTAQSFGTIPALSTSNWTSIGPQPTSDPNFNLTSGRVNAIAVDPCDTTGNTVYIAGAQGGVWKTTNGGTNWTPLTDRQPSLAGGSLAVDPNLADCASGHTGRIYFGTGEENFSFDSFYGAGVLISTDGSGSASSWVQDKTFMPSATPQSVDSAGPFIGSLAIDPATSVSSGQVLLAGIQGVSTAIHSGVYQSTNGGSSWTMVLPSSTTSPQCAAGFDYGTGVAFDPGDLTGQTAYAALGVPFSTSNGLEACNGLYRSADGGTTWSRVTNLDSAVTGAGLSTANYGRMTIALAPGNPSNTNNTTIVVAIADITNSSDVLLGTFISTNGGGPSSSFRLLTAGNSNAFCNKQCFYDISVGIDPANPGDIFLGGGPDADGSGSGVSSVIFSNNGGATFGDVSVDNTSRLPVHVDTHAFAFAHPSGGGTIVYVGNDGGVWSSSNVESNPGGQSWTDLNTTLSLTQFYPGNSIHPSNPQIGFAGAQDNGTQKFDPTFNPSNPQETHNVAVCGDGGWTAIDPTTPSTVYAACEDIAQVGQNPVINKNQLDGEPGATFANWIALETPAMDADNANFVPPLVLDSANPQNIYFGTCRVWQSMTGGVSWADISGALDKSVPAGVPCPGPTSTFPGSLVITTMAVAPSDSNIVYVGAETPQNNPNMPIVSSLFVTATAGMGASASFGPLPTSSVIPNDRVVTQIAVSPTTKTTAYITYSGFSSCVGATPPCDNLGHVFKFDATAGGGSGAFTDITGNLPDVPVNDIVIDPNDATENTIYIATDVGVFGTMNAQASPSSNVTWSVLQSGLPHVECTSLKLNNTARVLLVGTHGRGDWELQLGGLAASALTGISPTSATAGGSSFTLTLNGQGFGVNPNVNFGATPLTSVGSGSQLTVLVPSSAITGSGVEAVTVTGASGSLNFSIEGPVPTLSSVSPLNSTGTTNPVTVTVMGSNFAANTGLAWTPQSGSQNGNTTLLAQNAGSLMGSGSSMSFTVTVPATLLQSTLAHMVPVTPRRPWPSPKYWLLAAFFAAVAGILLFASAGRKRRLIFGATLATVIVLLSIAGCGGGSKTPPPGSVLVNLNAYTPGPGGGFSAATASFTVNP
ncbi:MAG TPA: hypothetical protein VGR72_11025 [Candidatus Acidoferrales bacterium]|nr:hypothetical protein [Candidatus Acidoferrales bacterium]